MLELFFFDWEHNYMVMFLGWAERLPNEFSKELIKEGNKWFLGAGIVMCSVQIRKLIFSKKYKKETLDEIKSEIPKEYL